MKKYELSTIQGKDIVLDISQLLKEEVLYVNVTRLARQFGKDRRQVDKFLKTKSFLEYENAVFKVIQKSDFKTEQKGLRYSVKGKYGGTYLHSDLLIVFLRWLNPEFAVKCDLFIKHTIQKTHDEKIEARAAMEANRANEQWLATKEHGKNTRLSLTDKIKEFCKYAEQQRGSSYNGGCPFYIHITQAVYEFLGVESPKAGKAARDIYSGAVLEIIEETEQAVIQILNEIMAADESRKAIKKQITNRLKRAVGNKL